MVCPHNGTAVLKGLSQPTEYVSSPGGGAYTRVGKIFATMVYFMPRRVYILKDVRRYAGGQSVARAAREALVFITCCLCDVGSLWRTRL